VSRTLSEKRVSRRVPVALTAHCRIGTRHLKDAVVDLSQGGLYLETRAAASVGTPVRMALALPAAGGASMPRAEICTLVGAVTRQALDARGRPKGLGVAFEEAAIDPSHRRTLAGFLHSRG
jgi:hypothetical protein